MNTTITEPSPRVKHEPLPNDLEEIEARIAALEAELAPLAEAADFENGVAYEIGYEAWKKSPECAAYHEARQVRWDAESAVREQFRERHRAECSALYARQEAELAELIGEEPAELVELQQRVDERLAERLEKAKPFAEKAAELWRNANPPILTRLKAKRSRLQSKARKAGIAARRVEIERTIQTLG